MTKKETNCKNLPELCYSTLHTCEIIVIKRGETGYYRTKIHAKNKEEAKEIANEYNKMLGVTRAQEEAMKIGSMFGFNVPGANPNNYDENGMPIHKN